MPPWRRSSACRTRKRSEERRVGKECRSRCDWSSDVCSSDLGAQVVIVAVPKPSLLPSPADFYAAVAKEFGVPHEEATLRKILTNNELKSDAVHPNAAGYARLAEAIATLLKKSGAV